MLFSASIVLLAAATACLPVLVRYAARLLPGVKIHPASPWLPVAAGALMIVSTLLPDVHISDQTSTFQQHFVGGGLYALCLYLYARQLLAWRLRRLADILVLFAWVSAFGVANKLVEFAFLQLGLVQIDTTDMYWDLLANTLGALAGYTLLAWSVKPEPDQTPRSGRAAGTGPADAGQ